MLSPTLSKNEKKSWDLNFLLSSFVWDYKNKCVKQGVMWISSWILGFFLNLENRVYFHSTSLSVLFIWKSSTSHIVANTWTPTRGYFFLNCQCQLDWKRKLWWINPMFKQLTFFHWHSQSSYTQANGHIENFATMATSVSQYHIVSPLQRNYFRLMVKSSTFPVRYGSMSAHEVTFSNLQQVGNTWL